jgi:hypothetical protein
MKFDVAASLPWMVAFVVVLALYVYVRTRRINKSKKPARR